MKLSQEFKLASVYAGVTAALLTCEGAFYGAAIKCAFNNLVPMPVDVLQSFNYAECIGAGALLMFGLKGIKESVKSFNKIYAELKPPEPPVRRKPANWNKADAVDVEFRIIP